jgi:branched-subunit amino acid transport protein
MTTVWAAVAIVGLICIALRAAGPLLMQGRSFPRNVERGLELAVPALLAAFVAVQTLASHQRLVVDARVVGLAAASAAIVLRRSPAVILLAAAAAAALFRAVWG